MSQERLHIVQVEMRVNLLDDLGMVPGRRVAYNSVPHRGIWSRRVVAGERLRGGSRGDRNALYLADAAEGRRYPEKPKVGVSVLP